jgi:hypothetical protein
LYSDAAVSQASRKLNAILADGVTAWVRTSGGRDRLAISVTNSAGMTWLYEFTTEPALSDAAIVDIANEWRTGTLADLPSLPAMRDKGAFLDWARSAKPGQTVVYFTGELAQFRATAPQRILQLQRLADQARPAAPRPPGEAIELARLQDAIELIQAATTLQQSETVALTQRRSADGKGWMYCATRR